MMRSVGALGVVALLAVSIVPVAADTTALERRASADGVEVRITLDRVTLWIDERIEMRIRAEAAEGLVLELPELESVPDGLAAVEQVRAEPVPLAGGRRAWEWRILLEPTATGRVALPSLELVYRPPGAGTDTRLGVEPLAVEVRSVLPPGDTPLVPRGPAPPVPLPPAPLPPGLWLAVGAGLLILVLAAALLLRRWRRRARPPAAGPSPEAQALAELARLEAEPATDPETLAEQQVRLADILRRWVRGRLGLEAPRLTTEELAERLVALGPDLARPTVALTTLLAACDRVKFARHRPPAGEARATLAGARAVVLGSARPDDAPTAIRPG